MHSYMDSIPGDMSMTNPGDEKKRLLKTLPKLSSYKVSPPESKHVRLIRLYFLVSLSSLCHFPSLSRLFPIGAVEMCVSRSRERMVLPKNLWGSQLFKWQNLNQLSHFPFPVSQMAYCSRRNTPCITWDELLEPGISLVQP